MNSETPTILYVDDRETNRYSTTRRLRQQGFEVIEASTGMEGLEKARLNPDCVLLDVNLPDINGFEVCRRIKSMPGGEYLPVVMFSAALIEDRDRVEGLEGGADAYITQPTDFSVLVATLKALLRARRAQENLRINEERFRISLKHSPLTVFNQDRDLRYTWIHNPVFGYTAEEMIGRRDQDMPPTNESRLIALKRKVLDTGVGIREEVSLHDTPGRRYDFDLTVEPMRDPGGEIVGITCAAWDITEQKEIENAERQQRVLAEALRDTAMTLSSTLHLPEVLDRILENIREVVAHETADIMLVEDGIATVVRSVGYAEHGLNEQSQTERMSLHEPGIAQHIYTTRKPYVIRDVRVHPYWKPLSSDEWLLSYAGIPIIGQEQVLGFLNVTSAKLDGFSTEQIEQLQVFATQAAVAIQNARLYEQAKQAAALEERQRLSRDLHDAVSQMLFASSLISESLVTQMGNESARLKGHLDRIHRLNRGALAEMRTLLMELRLEELKELNLAEMLGHLCDSISGRTFLEISLKVEGRHQHPKVMQITLFRIAQEAFNNIVKHANATSVAVRLDSQPDHVTLSIKDDGRGFDPHRMSWQSMGLNIMRERANAIGASLRIQSSEGSGTTVIVTWDRAGTPEPKFLLGR